MLDFSLHGEKGKRENKMQRITSKERKSRFSENHSGQAVEERLREYGMKKTDKDIEMVKHAIKQGIRFDFLLTDSWFTNSSFVKLITSRHIKCHLLGMIKLGNTRYQTPMAHLRPRRWSGSFTKLGLCKHNATLRCTYCTIDVKYAGRSVRCSFASVDVTVSGMDC